MLLLPPAGRARHEVTYKRALAVLSRFAPSLARGSLAHSKSLRIRDVTSTSQQIAQLEAKIARLKAKDRALENGQKIIIGGIVLAAARTDPSLRKWLISEAAKVSRPADAKRLAPLIDELRSIDGPVSVGDALQMATPKIGGSESRQTDWGAPGIKSLL